MADRLTFQALKFDRRAQIAAAASRCQPAQPVSIARHAADGLPQLNCSMKTAFSIADGQGQPV